MVRQLVRQLVYTIFVSNNRTSFHLWRKENLIKHQKASKYYETTCSYQISAYTNSFHFFNKVFPKRVFPVDNGKMALERALMVVAYYIKLFCTEADRRNGILMSLLLLVADNKTFVNNMFLLNMNVK